MQITNTVLLDLDGAPIKQQTQPGVMPKDDAPDLTVAKVLLNAALSPAQGPQQTYTPEKNAERYTLAMALNKAAVGETLEVSVELASDLKKDVMKLYAPLVAGQMATLLA